MRVSVIPDGKQQEPLEFDFPKLHKLQVRDLKRHVAEKIGLEPGDMRLIFEGWKELSDSTLLTAKHTELGLRTPMTWHLKGAWFPGCCSAGTCLAPGQRTSSLPALAEDPEDSKSLAPGSPSSTTAESEPPSPQVGRANAPKTTVQVDFDGDDEEPCHREVYVDKSSAIFQLLHEAQGTLGSLSVRRSVQKPSGVSRETWIAAKVIGIYAAIGHLAAALRSVCTAVSCPKMHAGPSLHWEWADENDPKPRQVSAPEYMRLLLELAFRTLSKPEVIPPNGTDFPEAFEGSVRLLLKRFLRVYIHAYKVHLEEVSDHGAFLHLNSSFKHFLFFVREFDLVHASEFAPIDSIVQFYEEEDRKIEEEEDKAWNEEEARQAPEPDLAPQATPPALPAALSQPPKEGQPDLGQAWMVHVDHGNRQVALAVAESVRLPRGCSFETWIAGPLARVVKGIRSLKGVLDGEVSGTSSCCQLLSTGALRLHVGAQASTTFPEEVCASEYASLWLDWAQATLRNGALANEISRPEARSLLRHALPLYMHCYEGLFRDFERKNVLVVLNGCFQHFLQVALHFRLLGPSDFGQHAGLVERLALDLRVMLPRGAIACPSGHPLQRHAVAFRDGGLCDLCCQPLQPGEAVWDCSSWEFAVCEGCRNHAWRAVQAPKTKQDVSPPPCDPPESPLPAAAPLLRLLRRATASAVVAEKARKGCWPPADVGEGPWVSARFLSAFGDLSGLQASLAHVCTAESCPCLRVGEETYTWLDEPGSEPRELSAFEQRSLALERARAVFQDEAFSAPDLRWEFTERLAGEMQDVARQLLRAFAHAWVHHYAEIERAGFKEQFGRCLRKFLRTLRDTKILGQADCQPLFALSQSAKC